jgi:hypothetical protein
MRSLSKSLAGACLTLLISVVPSVRASDETRRVEGLAFDRVILIGDSQLEISQGDEVSLQLRGSSQFLDPEPFYLKGDTLVLGAREHARSSKAVDTDGKLLFRVVMPVLRELRVQGSGEVYLKPFVFEDAGPGRAPELIVDGSGEINMFSIAGGRVEMRVGGAGDIKAETVNVDDLEAVVAGSGGIFIRSLQAARGELVITGSGDLLVTEKSYVQELEVSVVGSGDAELAQLGSRRAEINVVGSGDIDIGEVAEKLNASVLGSGDVSYRGNPEVDRVELGSGEVRRRD